MTAAQAADGGEWLCAARRLRRRIRLGWFWSAFLPWGLAATGLGAGLVWLLRGFGPSVLPGVAAGAGLAVAGLLHAADQ